MPGRGLAEWLVRPSQSEGFVFDPCCERKSSVFQRPLSHFREALTAKPATNQPVFDVCKIERRPKCARATISGDWANSAFQALGLQNGNPG